MSDQKEDALAALKSLASILGVDLTTTNIAIATPNSSATARFHDSSIEAKVVQWGDVRIETPRGPGIYIKLVDHQREFVPPEAIFRIEAYMPDRKNSSSCPGTTLNGDIYSINVGVEGLILDDAAIKRAAKLSQD